MKRAKDFRKTALGALRGKWIIALLAGLVAGLVGAESSAPDLTLNVDASGVDLDLSVAGQTIFSTGGEIDSGIAALLIGGAIYITIAAIVLAVVFFILSSIVSVGYARFNLDLVDDAPPSVGALFAPAGNWKTVSIAQLLQTVYIFLWTMLLIIPGILAIYNYALTSYLLAEYPELSASEAIKRSKQMMRGNRWRLFCLHLSFIGWDILCMLTLGIGNLWLRPYKCAADAAFYRDVAVSQPIL